MTTHREGKVSNVDLITSQVTPGTLNGFVNDIRRRKFIDDEKGMGGKVRDTIQKSTGNAAGSITQHEDGSRAHLVIKTVAVIDAPESLDDAIDRGYTDFDNVNPDESAFIARAPITKEQAFEIVKSIRALVSDQDSQSDQTQAAYLKIADRIERTTGERFDEPSALGWQEVLNSVAPQQRTFRLYRAAICWQLRRRIRRALADQDQVQRSGHLGESWLHKVAVLKELGDDYRSVKDHKRATAEYMEGMRPVENESKRLDLPIISKKYPDWKIRMLEGGLGGDYADVIRAMDLVGPRPAEFLTGVVVDLDASGEASVTISGAKVDDVRGQPWRKIFFPLRDLPVEWMDRLKVSGRFVISINSVDALRSALHRISARMLPTVPFATAYVFRHAVATRLRRQGFSAEEIGAFMGHTAAETQRAYGFRS